MQQVTLLASSENSGLTWNCTSQVNKGEEGTTTISQSGIPPSRKGLCSDSLIQWQDTWIFHLNFVTIGIHPLYVPVLITIISATRFKQHVLIPLNSNILLRPRDQNVFFSAFILHIPMNQRWCHANSLCWNCKIEIRQSVGGRVVGSSILLSNDSKMALPGQLLQAIMAPVSSVQLDWVQSLI